MGLAKRRLYKPDRAPARAKHWRHDPSVRLTEADLSLYEAEIGIAAVGWDSGIGVGRVLGYDPHRNVFHVVGKRVKDKRAVDCEIAGWRVSQAVVAARILAGVKRLTREIPGR